MIELRVYKHYSISTFHDLPRAQKRLERLKELYPDRCYIITVNKRAYSLRYKVEQVRQVDLRLSAPTEPAREHYATPADYLEAHRLWENDFRFAVESVERHLMRGMND